MMFSPSLYKYRHNARMSDAEPLKLRPTRLGGLLTMRDRFRLQENVDRVSGNSGVAVGVITIVRHGPLSHREQLPSRCPYGA